MNRPEAEEQLDALLRESETYVEDAGFTARVVSALPRRRRFALRPIILSSALLIGFALLAWMLPWKDIFVRGPGGVIELTSRSFVLLAGGLVVIATLFWGLFAVVRGED